MFSTIRRFIFLWSCFFLSQDLSALTTQLEYGGVSFICDYGCGHPKRDDIAHEILFLFETIQDRLEHFYPYKSSYLPHGLLETEDWMKEFTYPYLEDCSSPICRKQQEFLEAFQELKEEFSLNKTRYYQGLEKEKRIYEKNIDFVEKRFQDPNISRPHLVEVRDGRAEELGVFVSCYTMDSRSFLESQQRNLDFVIQELAGNNGYALWQAKLEEAYTFIDSGLKETFFWCLENHQTEGINFRNALAALLQRDYADAMHWLRELLDALNEESFSANEMAKIHLLRGQLELEYGLHAQAIESLTEAIAKSPEQREAYFERAAAYFESGDFEKAIVDFLHFDSLPTSSQEKLGYADITAIGLGITKGIIKGAAEGCIDFVPEVLDSSYGLAHGLWALCSHPISTSRAFAESALACINYIRNHSTKEVIEQMVPELRELIEQFHTLGNFEKGEAIGQIIGKFGTDILLTKGSVKLYQRLRVANQSMTLKALTSSTGSEEIIREATKYHAHRQKILESSNLKVQWDKQGKHLKDHRNYNPKINSSILEHPDPEKLIKEYAGKGRKTPRSTGEHCQPGYKEVVDFQEFIGYHVNKETGARISTTKGKIHYAKDGVHIVPAHPEQ